jgi:hypothetical protein
MTTPLNALENRATGHIMVKVALCRGRMPPSVAGTLHQSSSEWMTSNYPKWSACKALAWLYRLETKPDYARLHSFS